VGAKKLAWRFVLIGGVISKWRAATPEKKD
jgi:hypothetical protein